MIPKYSVILYYPEMYKEDLEYVEKLLLDGTVVHLFLISTLNVEMGLNEYEDKVFSLAKQNNLLFIYENQENLSDENEVIAVDGAIINKEIYKNICESRDCEFNYQQYNIITAAVNSNIIVTSGAGTGKTTTMISRLIFLRKTETDFSFEKAALITFTNKASIEMREKLVLLLEKYFTVTRKSTYLEMIDEASRCHISTIHGFSKKLINEYGKDISINRNIKIKSYIYKRKRAVTEAINKVYREHKNLYKLVKYYPLYKIEDKLLRIWEQLDNYSIDVNSQNYNVKFGEDEKDFSIFLEKVLSYAQEILENDKEYELEVSDLMKKLSYKDLFKNVGDRWSLIMVDEFQDSDNIQIEFVASFCKSTNCNLIVVGDEKQSIYRFRGAEHTSFYKIKELLSDSSKQQLEFTMQRNYRTYAKLLEDINNVFINIDKRVSKFKYKEKDYIYSLVNANVDNKIEKLKIEENNGFVEFYNELRDKKKDSESIAVLFRTNKDIKEFKDFCDKYNIACRVDVPGQFYRHEAVRDFYIMVKALIGTSNNGNIYSFINGPYINEQIDKSKILQFLSSEINDYFKRMLNENGWNIFEEKIRTVNPIKLLDDIITAYNPVRNYYKKTFINARKNQINYKDIAYIKALDYKFNLEHLIFLIKNNFSDNIASIYEIENFLKLKIATDTNVDVRKLEDKYEKRFIQCLTVHKAKGLEYDYVVLPKLTNSFFSYKGVDVILRGEENNLMVGFNVKIDEDEYKNDYYSRFFRDENSEIIGEEARLLYVAMTRCRKKLYINIPGIASTETINNWKSLLVGGVSGV